MERVKNTCKLIKLYGQDALEKYRVARMDGLHEMHRAVHQCALPEWED